MGRKWRIYAVYVIAMVVGRTVEWYGTTLGATGFLARAAIFMPVFVATVLLCRRWFGVPEGRPAPYAEPPVSLK